MCVFGCCWTSSLAFNGYVTMYVFWTSSLAFNGYVTMYVFWTSIGWISTMHVYPNVMKICNICSFFVTNVVSSTI